MKVVIAPDSFKESMSAYEASLAIQEGLKEYDSSIETLLNPMADGGEGTLETMIHAMKGTIEEYEVHGPFMTKVKAPIGYVEDVAIIECAKVCGLELLSEEEKNPYHTSTYGLGELIRHALLRHVNRIMICLGGSATNDGGIGMLQALGVSFLDKNHQMVPPTMAGLQDIIEIDLSQMVSLNNVTFMGVCDVQNPLCGEEGATYIYGPQKGVKLSERQMIDEQMNAYALKADHLLGGDYRLFPGSGAAGGLGYALIAFLKADLRSGFDIVSEVTHLEEKIKQSDCVIVGEGKMDKQTQFGKTPYGVLKIAQKYNKKVYAFAGKVEDLDILRDLGFENVYAISPLDIELSVALKKGTEFLKSCVYKHVGEML